MNKLFTIDEYGVYIYPVRICTKQQLDNMVNDKKITEKHLHYYYQFKILHLYFFIRK